MYNYQKNKNTCNEYRYNIIIIKETRNQFINALQTNSLIKTKYNIRVLYSFLLIKIVTDLHLNNCSFGDINSNKNSYTERCRHNVTCFNIITQNKKKEAE